MYKASIISQSAIRNQKSAIVFTQILQLHFESLYKLEMKNIPMNPETLSLEQLAGQRLMVGFEGKQFNPDLKHLIGDLKVGGIILFSQNAETPHQL